MNRNRNHSKKIPMKLQTKTLAVFIILLVAMLVIISFFASFIVVSSFAELEQQYIRNDLDQMVKKIHDEENTLSALVSDWGPWDDSYDFVNGQKPDFIDTNLLPETYDNLRLNIVVFTDREGNILYQGLYDLENKSMEPVLAFFSSQFKPGKPLMNLSDPRQATVGILMTPSWPMIIASRPIVHTDFSGTPAGVMIMGRYLDTREIQRLSELTQPDLGFTRLDDSSLSPDLLTLIRAQEGEYHFLVRPLENGKVEGYALIRDVSGNDALIFHFSELRKIYSQGIGTVFTFIILILGTGLMFGLVVIYSLNNLVLSRLSALHVQVHSISEDRSIGQRIDIAGDDEFSSLAEQINLMLQALENAQQGLHASEEKYRALTENTPDILFSTDMIGIITYASPQINKYGFLVEEVIGRSLRKFIHPGDIAQVEDNLTRQFIEGAQFISRFRILDKWGNICWFEEKVPSGLMLTQSRSVFTGS